jgi:hypothetical protein
MYVYVCVRVYVCVGRCGIRYVYACMYVCMQECIESVYKDMCDMYVRVRIYLYVCIYVYARMYRMCV